MSAGSDSVDVSGGTHFVSGECLEVRGGRVSTTVGPPRAVCAKRGWMVHRLEIRLARNHAPFMCFAVRGTPVHAESEMALRPKLKYKGRYGFVREPFSEGVHGADLHRDSGIWMHLTCVFDRARNWCTGRAVNPKTGEVVHECA